MSTDPSDADDEEQYGYFQIWITEKTIGILSFTQESKNKVVLFLGTQLIN